jgi:hypothetical protein
VSIIRRYAEILVENKGPRQPLPGFYAVVGRTVHDPMIVGIGFEPTPLLSLLQDHRASKIRLIFPFPPRPSGHQRNWMSDTLPPAEQSFASG